MKRKKIEDVLHRNYLSSPSVLKAALQYIGSYILSQKSDGIIARFKDYTINIEVHNHK